MRFFIGKNSIRDQKLIFELVFKHLKTNKNIWQGLTALYQKQKEFQPFGHSFLSVSEKFSFMRLFLFQYLNFFVKPNPSLVVAFLMSLFLVRLCLLSLCNKLRGRPQGSFEWRKPSFKPSSLKIIYKILRFLKIKSWSFQSMSIEREINKRGRVVETWNRLSSNAVNAMSVNSFKAFIDREVCVCFISKTKKVGSKVISWTRYDSKERILTN
ncbi:hypothetical protein BpHYR1_050513 [Brachionus plicatilis]|uniref:Uncharacterized protein n=1 Tax=Brachionus plicatilis TaxID=10195 RepID=A0A3M7S8X6_BRAPC|nr:hypothetical protein BpHYR1_050513 [Brachionus plicatilis]